MVNKLITGLSSRLKGNEIAIKIINNASWLVGDKVYNMVIGVFVMALVARYLGPENYGIYNYSLAFVTLFTSLSTLGLETLSVKSIVQQEEEEGTILFTSLVLRVIGGILLTFFSSLIIRFISPSEPLIHLLVLIMSFAMIFKSLEVIEYWIQANQKSKISSLIRMSVYTLSALLKVAFVLLEGSLTHLALIYMSDALIIGIALVIAYFKNRTSQTKWKFSYKYAKSILSQSWFLIISGFMVTIYMQIDKVMLGSMLVSKEELGIYSAATQVATMWYFVPLAIINSFKPVIMKRKKINENSYLNSLQLLYTIISWTSIGFGILVILFSNIIIDILFGSNYLGAGSILSISIWAGTFAMLGTVTSTWLVCEGLQKYSIIFVFWGAIINVCLNLLLIPQFGGYGAAIATIAAQVVSNLIIPFFIKKTRYSFIMIYRAFTFRGVGKTAKQ